MKISIKQTNTPTIIKFEFPEFITNHESFEFKNIDEAQNSPIAQKLFYLPFVKTVYISSNFIAIERFSIVEWIDVQDEVAQQIEQMVADGTPIILESATPKKVPVTIYGETTPNPAVLKFVSNKLFTKVALECKNIDDTQASPIAKELFHFPYVKEIFIDENYISITKFESYSWDEITSELRTFIKQFIENGGTVIQESLIEKPKKEKQTITHFDALDITSQQIVNILEEYVKPAVQADGGNILFDSYNPDSKQVRVVLQGSCNGCPSSTFTLKNGIENMLKSMLNDNEIVVEAIN
ncbi:Fe-S cluster biogenesis protein NfuA [Flavobacterium croceum DSM 17960]|uniref:Fe-S cluster biogenesis protein NfuA n=1 Tax=Flavobacterium croceum DSM 17960 TaxID=1121886 RepID=A0A2S4N505_9FLAO|nr:NifU family protein [Flavobacterium croceum]POS00814.1 Fe-S cluster biogenesis protein NfuA [Flavobacterium croceum DSM 17960]